jgi:hypothetical protein
MCKGQNDLASGEEILILSYYKYLVFHVLFGEYSEFQNLDTPRHIPEKISFLCVKDFEKMFQENLMLDAYAYKMP